MIHKNWKKAGANRYRNVKTNSIISLKKSGRDYQYYLKYGKAPWTVELNGIGNTFILKKDALKFIDALIKRS